uniref:Uncharacterized protein n=1 Tax=Meloidogyne enterolobii TaxID=390850 RepID=A0A6V7UBF2_MELEN|nr:unnamed protein product [Meloidogyne enterolobii]
MLIRANFIQKIYLYLKMCEHSNLGKNKEKNSRDCLLNANEFFLILLTLFAGKYFF